MAKDASADGLRGIAAANVVLCHSLISLFPLGFRYLWPGAALPSVQLGLAEKIISAPFLSVLWNGNFPVCIFFVLSGYVLSAKFWRDGDVSALTTMALRRYVRLGIPVLGSVLFAYFMMVGGLNDLPRTVAAMTGNAWMAQFWNFDPALSDAVMDGVFGAMLHGSSPYVPVLWTMRVELLGSFLVFGYAALAPRGRLAPVFFVTVTVAIASIDSSNWPLYAGFLLGVHIGRMTRGSRSAVLLAVVGAIFFGAFDKSPLFDWTLPLSVDFTWRKHFFNVLGGACAVFAIRFGFAKAFLTSAPIQFLGRISYSLYLVHFPLTLCLLGGVFRHLMDGGWSRGPAALVAMTVTFIAACAVAAIFQRTFDTWGIALSHRLFPGRAIPAAPADNQRPTSQGALS
ncbi:MAG: hypothetical protein GAK28_04070 [Luteibacter sp.]|uniref:acyltransferase family protein n=1 Tax=Luteibacter sp. TaxID=1886636 RepID=UPI00137CDF77|nr:acyltransferase [Luteibacter sp.]KAF1004363.1 MAG: hypothetical protein GAK28_04070 [Luteibacter sp.]